VIGAPQVTWEARDKSAEDLVFACVRGELPFSGPNSLHTAFSERGWSTRYLYEAVRNAERATPNT
jgi:hypothetical protein